MEKEEFLRLLPRLIREDDEVKGAIISALSSVMATKNDIERIIEHSDKRFEAVQKQMDKRFEVINERITKTQEILISHSETLKIIAESMQDIRGVKDLGSKMIRLENSSATHYKTLDGKIDTKYDILNEKIEKIDKKMATKEDIKEIKEILQKNF